MRDTTSMTKKNIQIRSLSGNYDSTNSILNCYYIIVIIVTLKMVR